MSNGEYTLIDDDVLPIVEHFSPVHKRKDGYAVVRVTDKKILLHRLIMNPSRQQVIDHLNGDILDNTRDNLSICKQVDNMNNRQKYKYGKGVEFSKRHQKFMARFIYYGKRYYGGYFDTAEEASKKVEDMYARLLSV